MVKLDSTGFKKEDSPRLFDLGTFFLQLIAFIA